MPSTNKPRLIVIAGPNGSGKTSIADTMHAHHWLQGCDYINPDTIAQEHFGNWNSPEAVKDAADWAAKQREACLEDGRDLAFETVLSAPDKVDFVVSALQAGYFVRLIFVATQSPSINAARVAQRVMEGGHDVPISKIISRYPKSIANCLLLAPHVQRLYVYDNSLDNAAAALCFRATDGVVMKRGATTPAWSDVIQGALKK